MLVKKVLVIPITHFILNEFKHKQMFLPAIDTRWLPDELIGSADLRPKEGLLVSQAYFQLWPCSIISHNAKICTYWDKDNAICHLWIGNNMLPEDLRYGNNALSAALQRILNYFFRSLVVKEKPFFLGYICSKHDTKQNAFGLLHHVKTKAAAKLLNNDYIHERWLTIAELKQYYRKLDPWSKRIFDYIYENPNIREKLGLYQRIRKSSIKTD